MAVTLDDFGNYSSDPTVNVSRIYAEAAAVAPRVRIFSVLVKSTPPIESAAPYQWGACSRTRVQGGTMY